ncbi:MAG: NB-ARC domain-containing protein [Actinomycetota bacterium]
MDKKQVRATFDSLRRSPKCKVVLERLLAGHSRPKIQADLEMTEDALNQNLRQLYKKFHIWGDDERKLHRLLDLIRTSLPELTSDEYEMPVAKKRQDWGEAIDVPVFFGRTDELTTLKQWILQDSCRLVALLGMGGIGKTALSIHLAQQIKNEFEYVIWRSLRNAPPIKEILADLINFLSDQRETNLPENIEGRISLLIDYCRQHRCLLVLDNAEAILRGGDRAGYYQEGYENYADLFKRVGESPSHSCLVLTSREKPREIDRLEGKTRPVRSLQLTGLKEEAQEILKEKGLSGSDKEFRRLIDFYQGNPLALEIVPATIKRLFKGNIYKFIETGTAVFGDIRDLLEEQFSRLSPLEKEVMYWLAINREPVLLTDLEEDIVSRVALPELIEALDSLGLRSLLQESDVGFTQQPVVMEYIINRLIENVCKEITTLQIALFNNYPLIKATGKDYIREIQVRLILKPVTNRLLTEYGTTKNFENQMTKIISIIRDKILQTPGYGGGNILNLLIHLKTDLRGYNFSNLTIWQAYLQNVNLHQVNFSYSDLDKSVFSETFGTILSVEFSPDTKLLATGDVVGEIRLWQVAKSQQLFVFKGHTNWVRSVTFSPDGQTLASGSDDQTIKLWDVGTGQCLKTLQGHTKAIRAVAFSPNGQTLASGSEDLTIRFWDLRTGQCLKIIQAHTNWIWSVAFSPDSKTLASGSTDQTIKLWNAKTGENLKTLKGHTNWVQSVAFSRSGQMLASGSDDQTIRLWDIGTGQCLKILQGHNYQVRSVAFSPDGHTLVSGSDDQTIRLWDIRTGQCVKILQGHSNWVQSVAFNPDGKTLASGSSDQTVKQWDINTGQCLKTLQGYTNWIQLVAFKPDGQTLAGGCADRTVRLWDINTGLCIKTLQGHTNWVQSIAFSPDGQMLVSGSADQTVKVWDIDTGQCLKTLQRHTNAVRSVAFSPDGRIFASGSDDHSVIIWNVSNGECLEILRGHTNRVKSVAFSPDGQTLVSSANDQKIKVWNVFTGKCLITLEGHSNRVGTVAFNSNGQMLVSGSEDKTVKLWDVGTGQCLKTLQGHTKAIRSVTFNPDGQILASGSEDKTVKLWDVGTGQCLKTLQGHSDWVWSVTFSPDGQTLASGSEDKTVKLWNLKLGKCLKTLKAPRPYEEMDITGITGLTEAQKFTLLALGAVANIA